MKIKIRFLKKLIIPALIFVFLFLPFIASAAVGFGDVVNWIKLLPINTVDYIIGIFVRISGFFANAAGALLDWVTSPSFISLPYTKAGPLPDGNPIIEVGLNITKNFVNLCLVIVIVFIALAITLRLEEYATQKTLVRLIAVALLVNFAPIICGLIVDASNIVMNYFLVGIREGISGLLNDISGNSVTAVLTRPGTVKASYLLTKGLTMMVLNLSIAIIFLLIALVFIFRYVAIWVLVILSPLAFVAWILPATKKLWDTWWKQLLNWSFIGIPLAFFLYLAMRSVAGLNTYFDTQMTSSGLEVEELKTLNMVFPYFAVLAILWFGLFIGLGTAALGSSAVVNFAKSRGGQALRGAWKGGKATAGIATAGAAGAIRGAREGQGIKGRISGAGRGALTFEGREKGKESMGRMLERMHVAKPGTYEETRRKRWKIEEESKKMEKLPTDRLHEIADRTVIRPADRAGSIAAFEALAKRGALKDNEKHLTQKMQSFGADTSQVLKARPDWAPNINKNIKQQIASVSTGDFTKNVQAAALKSAEVVVSLDTPKISHMGLRGSAEQKAALREAVTQNSSTFNEIYNKINQLYAQNTQQSNQEGDRIMDILIEISSNVNLRP